MRITMSLAMALALSACSQTAESPPAAENVANEAGTAAADANAAAATPAALASINETTWTFTEKDGTKVKESIDAKGNYITNALDGKHVDHGTAVMKDGKACFTSAMNKEGEVCWSDPKLAVGESGETTSDKGEKLTVTRVAYEPMTMPG
jgi:ABC-type glycerol-3-phosphate transport system substrate-binding protein